MNNKLAVLDRTIPLRNFPEQDLNRALLMDFLPYITKLLSLTDEVSADRLEMALPAIKEQCIGMGFAEIKKMFEMYADNKLSIKPIPNYFDRILLGKIVSEYKQTNKSHTFKEAKSNIQELSKDDYQRILLEEFEQVKKTGQLNQMRLYLFDYLDDKKLLETDKNILSIIRKTAIENLENSKHLKNEIPVNKDEHNENKFELLFGENEILVEEKNIILMRFFNQFTTNDQILNKINTRS